MADAAADTAPATVLAEEAILLVLAVDPQTGHTVKLIAVQRPE